MPIIQRFATVTIRMYADDHHPPHFHIVDADFQVLMRISDMAIIAGAARKNQIAEALAWAKSNRDLLALKWIELTERG